MIHGVINVYKERGFTSHDVVAKLRGITHQKKIGHTGTLDPEAEGVLLVCFGAATRICSRHRKAGNTRGKTGKTPGPKRQANRTERKTNRAKRRTDRAATEKGLLFTRRSCTLLSLCWGIAKR